MQKTYTLVERMIKFALLGSCLFLFSCGASKTTPTTSSATSTPINSLSATQAPVLKFDFGSNNVESGYKKILPSTIYTQERGYGIVSKSPVEAIDRKGGDALKSDFITSEAPFYFVVDLPEGNYQVTVTLGDEQGEAITTVKAESRRLMLEKVQTAYGELVSHIFMVNVRTPQINDQ